LCGRFFCAPSPDGLAAIMNTPELLGLLVVQWWSM